MPPRELDDLQSGAIQKATLAPGEGGASPATGDLVRPRILPQLQWRRGTLAPVRPAESPEPRPGTPQVYVHVAVRERERMLQTTRADEGGSGVPHAFVLGKGRRRPRAWELALLGDPPQLLPSEAAPLLGAEQGLLSPACCVSCPFASVGPHSVTTAPRASDEALPVGSCRQ